MKIKILVGLLFLSLFLPTMSLAVSTDLVPEFNPICWHKADCDKTRADLLQKEVKEVEKDAGGWMKNEYPCVGEDWGKCLPSGITVTEVAFGGQKKFTNIGDFLKTNYNLALIVAGILAVIMIIVAGIQWVTSGGNSEAITSAKKRIGGAVTGLMIAYLSYAILNTVNPALVNLRLPQNFMVRPFNIVPEFCRDVATSTKFALASKKGEKVDKEKLKDPNIKMELLDQNQMGCGDNYFIEGGGSATCMGSACGEKNNFCVPFTVNGENVVNNMPSCQPAQLVVHYTIDPLVKLKEFFQFTADVEGKKWMNTDYSNPVWAVCEEHNSKKLYIGNDYHKWTPNTNNSDRKTIEVVKNPYNEYYLLINRLNPYGSDPGFKDTDWSCFDGDKILGFVLKSEFFVNLNPVNANFYTAQKYTGAWESINKNGYIDIPSLEKGTIINANINLNIMNDILNSKWSEPKQKYFDGAISGGVADPNPADKAQIDKDTNASFWKMKAGGGAGL